MNNNYRDRQRAPIDPLQDQFAANERIRSHQILLVDDNGDSLGVKPTDQALRHAYSLDLDLVVISPNANPPVAKICDYSKFIYNQRRLKKEQEKKSRESAIITKEIQLRPTTGQHDIDVKVEHAKEWLEDNCKIKVVLKFRGRELSHKDIGFDIITNFLTQFGDSIKIDRQPEMNANSIIAMISPVKSK